MSDQHEHKPSAKPLGGVEASQPMEIVAGVWNFSLDVMAACFTAAKAGTQNEPERSSDDRDTPLSPLSNS